MTEQLAPLPPAPDEQLPPDMLPEDMAPSPREAMYDAVAEAREATQELGPVSRIHTIDGKTEFLKGGHYHAPNVNVTQGRREVRVDATNEFTTSTGTRSLYHAYDTNHPFRPEDNTAGTVIQRQTENGETYTHRFKNPETAQKFATLIAKQVTRRNQAKAELKKAA